MIDPDDIFNLFEEDFNQDTPVDPAWASFDKGRVLGSRIIRKVDELITFYKSLDSIKDQERRDLAKDSTLSTYNKILLSYISKVPTEQPHTIRGIALEDATPVADLVGTLMKHYEKRQDYNACALLQTFKDELLYQDLTRDLWIQEYT